MTVPSVPGPSASEQANFQVAGALDVVHPAPAIIDREPKKRKDSPGIMEDRQLWKLVVSVVKFQELEANN